jgi:selenocysteine lyase/cysteine desulfurase
VGRRVSTDSPTASRRSCLVRGMEAIREYEATLSAEMLVRFAAMSEVSVYGIQDAGQLGGRVPTICFTVAGTSPEQVTVECAKNGIGVRDGNMYSPRLLRRLGITGAVRASLVHYNTTEEIDRFFGVLRRIVRN